MVKNEKVPDLFNYLCFMCFFDIYKINAKYTNKFYFFIYVMFFLVTFISMKILFFEASGLFFENEKPISHSL